MTLAKRPNDEIFPMGLKLAKHEFNVVRVKGAGRRDSSVLSGSSIWSSDFNKADLAVVHGLAIDLIDQSSFMDLATIACHGEQLTSARLSPDARVILAATQIGNIEIWAVSEIGWDCIHTIRSVHGGCAWAVEWIPDIGFASVGGDGKLVVWQLFSDLTLGEKLVKCPLHSKSATCLAVIPNKLGALIVTGSNDATVMISELLVNPSGGCSLNPKHRLVGHVENVLCVDCFISNQSCLVVSGGGDNSIRLWDLSDVDPGRLDCPVPHVTFPYQSETLSVKFSPNGKFVVAADTALIHILSSSLNGVQPEKLAQVNLRLPSGISAVWWTSSGAFLHATLENGDLLEISVPSKYL